MLPEVAGLQARLRDLDPTSAAEWPHDLARSWSGGGETHLGRQSHALLAGLLRSAPSRVQMSRAASSRPDLTYWEVRRPPEPAWNGSQPRHSVLIDLSRRLEARRQLQDERPSAASTPTLGSSSPRCLATLISKSFRSVGMGGRWRPTVPGFVREPVSATSWLIEAKSSTTRRPDGPLSRGPINQPVRPARTAASIGRSDGQQAQASGSSRACSSLAYLPRETCQRAAEGWVP